MYGNEKRPARNIVETTQICEGCYFFALTPLSVQPSPFGY